MAGSGDGAGRTGMSGLPLGRYRGVPVYAHWSLLLTALLIAEILASSVLPAEVPHRTTGTYWVCGAIGATLFLASVLAHELMHAVVARHYGVPVKRITLWLLGGMAEIEGEAPSPRAAAMIAGAGPATSLAVAVGFGLGSWCAAAIGLPSLVIATLLWLAVTNGILGVFNLLPGEPLDGGRLLQAVLWHRYQDSYRATVVATGVGRRLGLALVVLGALEALFVDAFGGLWLALIGWFLMGAARAESAGAAMRAVFPDITLGHLMRPLPAAVPSWWSVRHLREMRELSELIHDVLPVVDFDGRAVGVISWRELSGGNDDATLGALCRRLPVLSADSAALDLMRSGALARGAVLVQDEAGAVGIVTASDLEHAAALGAGAMTRGEGPSQVGSNGPQHGPR